MQGEENLRKFEVENLKKGVHKIADNIYCFTGYGYVNCSIIIGETSVILIDCVCTMDRARQLKAEIAKITDKPVKTIIYTRYSTMDQGGAGVFRDTVEEVISFKDRQYTLPYKEKLDDVINMYVIFNRGYGLNDDEALEKSILFRNVSVYDGVEVDFVEASTLYEEDHVERTIDGIELVMDYTPGMANDHAFIYVPASKTGFVGINYFNCFPSFLQLGTRQALDVSIWIQSLGEMMKYEIAALVPGKSLPVMGTAECHQALKNLRDGLDYILMTTLDLMNDGYTPDEIVERFKLPPELEKVPEMRPFYGHQHWLIRGIYSAYLGWFDGLASSLLPEPESKYNEMLYELIGKEKLEQKIDSLVAKEEYQMALQLCEILKDNVRKKKILILRARQTENVMARHYFLQRANEL